MTTRILKSGCEPEIPSARDMQTSFKKYRNGVSQDIKAALLQAQSNADPQRVALVDNYPNGPASAISSNNSKKELVRQAQAAVRDHPTKFNVNIATDKDGGEEITPGRNIVGKVYSGDIDREAGAPELRPQRKRDKLTTDQTKSLLSSDPVMNLNNDTGEFEPHASIIPPSVYDSILGDVFGSNISNNDFVDAAFPVELMDDPITGKRIPAVDPKTGKKIPPEMLINVMSDLVRKYAQAAAGDYTTELTPGIIGQESNRYWNDIVKILGDRGISFTGKTVDTLNRNDLVKLNDAALNDTDISDLLRHAYNFKPEDISSRGFMDDIGSSFGWVDSEHPEGERHKGMPPTTDADLLDEYKQIGALKPKKQIVNETGEKPKPTKGKKPVVDKSVEGTIKKLMNEIKAVDTVLVSTKAAGMPTDDLEKLRSMLEAKLKELEFGKKQQAPATEQPAEKEPETTSTDNGKEPGTAGYKKKVHYEKKKPAKKTGGKAVKKSDSANMFDNAFVKAICESIVKGGPWDPKEMDSLGDAAGVAERDKKRSEKVNNSNLNRQIMNLADITESKNILDSLGLYEEDAGQIPVGQMTDDVNEVADLVSILSEVLGNYRTKFGDGASLDLLNRLFDECRIHYENKLPEVQAQKQLDRKQSKITKAGEFLGNHTNDEYNYYTDVAKKELFDNNNMQGYFWIKSILDSIRNEIANGEDVVQVKDPQGHVVEELIGNGPGDSSYNGYSYDYDAPYPGSLNAAAQAVSDTLPKLTQEEQATQDVDDQERAIKGNAKYHSKEKGRAKAKAETGYAKSAFNDVFAGAIYKSFDSRIAKSMDDISTDGGVPIKFEENPEAWLAMKVRNARKAAGDVSVETDVMLNDIVRQLNDDIDWRSGVEYVTSPIYGAMMAKKHGGSQPFDSPFTSRIVDSYKKLNTKDSNNLHTYNTQKKSRPYIPEDKDRD